MIGNIHIILLTEAHVTLINSFYMATLLESLLFTKNPMYLDKILFEIKRYFNLEKVFRLLFIDEL